MGQRVELQALLETLAPNVYFQPPENLAIKHPCIIYQRDYAQTDYADNSPYLLHKRYQVTYIDRNPDSPVPDQIAMLDLCNFERFFTANNLNHDVFTLFF